MLPTPMPALRHIAFTSDHVGTLLYIRSEKAAQAGTSSFADNFKCLCYFSHSCQSIDLSHRTFGEASNDIRMIEFHDAIDLVGLR